MTAVTFNPPAVSGDDGSWHNTGAGSISLTATTISIGDADASNNARHGWLRYPNVYIHPGQTVNSFKINVRPSGLTGTIPPMTIVGVKQLNPAAPTTRAQANALVLTTATVAWTPATWVTGVRQDSPELKTILQEIVNQPGWVSGDAIIILLKVVEDVFTTANLLAFNAVDGGTPANYASASGDRTATARVDGHSLTYHMNRKAGTLVGGVPTRSAQGAANIWAATTDRELVGALNAKAGNAQGAYRELAGVLNQLAGTSGLEVDGAAASIP
jgi:hypothetical protein